VLTERSLQSPLIRRYFSFKDNLGICRDIQIHRFSLDDLNRPASQGTSHIPLINTGREGCHRNQHTGRVIADGNRYRHGAIHFPIFGKEQGYVLERG